MHGRWLFGTQMHTGGFDSVYAPLLSAPLAARSSNALLKAMGDIDVDHKCLLYWKLPRMCKSLLPGRTGAGCGGTVHKWAGLLSVYASRTVLRLAECDHHLVIAGVVSHFT